MRAVTVTAAALTTMAVRDAYRRFTFDIPFPRSGIVPFDTGSRTRSIAFHAVSSPGLNCYGATPHRGGSSC